MIQCHHRDDVVLNARIDYIVVMSNCLLIDRASTEWQDAAPRQAQRVRFDAKSRDPRDVVLVHVVVVVRHIRGVIVDHEVGGTMAEHIPDTGTSAAVFGCAFDLIGGASDTPPARDQ